MENKNGQGIFYGVIGVATLVVAIIGATFAYFSATATDNGNITGQTGAGGALSMSVTPVSGTNGALIPLSTTGNGNTNLTKALSNDENNGALCKDYRNNPVCNLFKISVKNESGAAILARGKMYVSSDAANIKWQFVTFNGSTYTPALNTGIGVQSSMSDGTLITTGTFGEEPNVTNNVVQLTATDTDYYVVVWLDDNGHVQDAGAGASGDDTDEAGKSYTGYVEFKAVNADGSETTTGLTATFNS